MSTSSTPSSSFTSESPSYDSGSISRDKLSEKQAFIQKEAPIKSSSSPSPIDINWPICRRYGSIVALLIILGGIVAAMAFVLNTSSSSTNHSSKHIQKSLSLSEKWNNYWWPSRKKRHVVFDTTLGKISGNVLSSPKRKSDIFEFLGISFCVPPVGARRFWPCLPLKTSFHEIPLDATEFKSSCWQPAWDGYYNYSVAEDCLSLNIWTPVDTRTPTEDPNLIPVMVFIYGGSMTAGSGAANDLTRFLDNEHIIGVTFNYRLGIFGFLQSEMLFGEGSETGYGSDRMKYPSYGGLNGIYDQIQAIRWVKDHIQEFGGNPDRITIFGESAGGISVCTLLISQLMPPIYQAISESGPCIGPWSYYDLQTGLQITENLLTTGTIYRNSLNDLHFLRYHLSADELYNHVQMEHTSATPWNIKDEPYFPSVDGFVLPDTTKNIFQQIANKIPLRLMNGKRAIFGFNSLDGAVSGPLVETEAMLHKYLFSYLEFDDGTAKQWLATHYNDENTGFTEESDADYYNNLWLLINSDVCMKCPILSFAEMFKNDDRFKHYFYYFKGTKKPSLAWHGSELAFLKIYYQKNSDVEPLMEWNEVLSKQMMNAWHSYANLEPDDEHFTFFNPATKNMFEWVPYNDDKNKGGVLIFDESIRMESDFRSNYMNNVCDFIDTLSEEKAFALCANTHFVV